MSGYLIPSANLETELIIKKSRFITFVFHTKNRNEAMTHLETLRERYPDARHHCWAYLLGDPKAPNSVAMSDDGEPSGTAGKPILNVMQHKDVGDIMIVVVRYFGGIKLGAGGLVRAYSGATQQAYSALTTIKKQNFIDMEIQCTFRDEQKIRHHIERLEGRVENIDYGLDLRILFAIPEQHVSVFQSQLSEFKITESGRNK
jgi:uncharacterized YigZ family protein